MAIRIMVVDPDPDARAILRTYLEHAGYAVRATGSPDGVYRQAREHTPDLIIGEHPLVLEDGRLLCAALQDQAETSGVPFLALSARAMPEEIEEAESTHRAVLIKPISMRDLTQAVAALTARPRPRRPARTPAW